MLKRKLDKKEKNIKLYTSIEESVIGGAFLKRYFQKKKYINLR